MECPQDLCRARAGAAVRFEDASAGSVRRRTWQFGDGTTSGERTVEHAWAAPGFYEVTLRVSDGSIESSASLIVLVESDSPAGTCEADVKTRCLRDSRYAVQVDWWASDGGRGAGRVVHSGTDESGLFWFFDPANWEMLIKVLDGCSVNGNVWVFAAATTDLGYVISVTDTLTGEVKEYRNEPGDAPAAITDAETFPQACGSSVGAGATAGAR